MSKIKVLIVEDEVSIANNLVDSIEEFDYTQPFWQSFLFFMTFKEGNLS